MNPMRQALADYLKVRRTLGYKLARPEKLLDQLLTYVETLGEQHLRTETMIAWATLPKDSVSTMWPSYRLCVVRGFARHLHAIDPATEVPPRDLLPSRRCRATPYLYSDEELAALMSAAATLRKSHRVATYQTLIGLLSVTGMRVGEAIALDRDDVDIQQGVLTIRKSKFGKSRELPLHPTTVNALHTYMCRHDRPRSATSNVVMFVSTAGTRLLYCNVQWTFQQLVRRVGLKPRSAACRPRLHDVRHSFAVRSVLDWYRNGDDTTARLPLLSTYLGHVDPGGTYWYLSAAPELLQLAGGRLQRHRGDAL
jgi:integrase